MRRIHTSEFSGLDDDLNDLLSYFEHNTDLLTMELVYHLLRALRSAITGKRRDARHTIAEFARAVRSLGFGRKPKLYKIVGGAGKANKCEGARPLR